MNILSIIQNGLRRLSGKQKFFGSKAYWQERYNTGGNSGSGSYGRLAHYKASFINQIIQSHGVKEIQEFGCGDGNQLSLLDVNHYIGWDVSDQAVEKCKQLFKNDSSKAFYVLGESKKVGTSEMSMSLDVIYHLIEDEVFEHYMDLLFNHASKLVVIYSCNFDSEPTANHVKPRKFSRYIELNFPAWRLHLHEINPFPLDPNDPNNTSWSDFFVYTKAQ